MNTHSDDKLNVTASRNEKRGRQYASKVGPTNYTMLDFLTTADADDPQWRQFWKLYDPYVRWYLHHRGLPVNEVEDVAQDVFVVVCAGLADFEQRERAGGFRKWLKRVTESRRADWFRTNSANSPVNPATGRTEYLVDAISPECDTEEHYLPGEKAANRDLFRRAFALIETDFSPLTVKCFLAYSLTDRTAADVADELGLAPSTVRGHARRIRNRVNEVLGETPGNEPVDPETRPDQK